MDAVNGGGVGSGALEAHARLVSDCAQIDEDARGGVSEEVLDRMGAELASRLLRVLFLLEVRDELRAGLLTRDRLTEMVWTYRRLGGMG